MSSESREDADRLLRSLPRAFEQCETFSDWYLWFDAPSGARRRISQRDLRAVTEMKQSTFSWIHPFALFQSCQDATHLHTWLSQQTPHSLAQLLDLAPSTIQLPSGSLRLTPWQRLFVCHAVSQPYDRVARVHVSKDDLQRLTISSQGDGTRKEGVTATFSRMRGSFPSVTICNLPPGTGSSLLLMSVALLAVTSLFPLVVSSYRDAALHYTVSGVPSLPVARLVLVCPDPHTVQQYVHAVEGLLPVFRERHPDLVFKFVQRVGKRDLIHEASFAPPHHVFVWMTSPVAMHAVLRRSPETAVAVCVSNQVAYEKVGSSKSHVIKHLLSASAGDALVSATNGRSWLRDYFGGAMSSPCNLHRFLQWKRFSDAQLLCEQICKLDVAWQTCYRAPIIRDLERFSPTHLDVVFVKTRRFTASSLLLGTTSDLVPATFAAAVAHFFREARLTEPSKRLLHDKLNAQTPCSLDGVKATLESLAFEDEEQGVALRTRLRERLGEFASACPICCSKQTRSVCVYNCCGYCVCETCFLAAGASCPFCRQAVHKAFSARDVCPQSPSPPPLPQTEQKTLADVLAKLRTTLANHSQLRVLSHAFCLFRIYEKRRILVVVEHYLTTSRFFRKSDAALLEAESGIGIYVVPRISGKGKAYANVRRQFDAHEGTAALLVPSDNVSLKSFFAGANLNTVDAIVSVGFVQVSLLFQVVDAVFHPGTARDNSQGITFLRIEGV